MRAEQGLESLAAKLTADGFQVICREVLPIACAKDALATLGEAGNRLLDEADAVIPLACAAGIAGPGGGSTGKPVGTVHIAVASAIETQHRVFVFPGDRGKIRWQASQAALDMLRRALIKM